MISLMSEEGHVKYKIYEFVIDTAAELSEVPTDVGVGSKVYCIEDSTVYMLNNSGEYKEVSFSSGGGSGDVESYTQLRNKPSINGVTLVDNKTSEDLGMVTIQEVASLPSTLVNNTIYVVDDESDVDNFYICINNEAHEIKGGMESIFLVNVLPTEKQDGALYIVKGDDSAVPPTKDKLYFYEEDEGLYEIDICEKYLYLVDELPTVKINNSLYIVKGNATATPPTTDKFYFYSNSSVYEINASVIDYRDDLRLLNKPQIDEHELRGLNNTHESLELISEKDFVSAPTSKTDGMEFILPEGTPDNPIEITEINDGDEVKYANNYTSSNYHINTNFDELYRLVKGKMQIVFEEVLPDPPAINTMYFIDTETPNVYHCWLVDSTGSLKDGGTTNIDLSGYVADTVKIGSNALTGDVTTAMLNSDLKDYTTEIKNKTVNAENNTITNIQTSNFKNNVIKTVIPETPLDTELLTAKATDTALKNKQDKLSAGSAVSTVTDETTVSNVNLTSKSIFPITASKIWDYIKSKITGAVSNLLTTNLTPSRVLVSFSSGKIGVANTTQSEIEHLHGVTKKLSITEASGTNAFGYASGVQQGLTIKGDYETETPRRAWTMGGLAGISFHCKGSTASNVAAWTTIGQVTSSYRPKYKTPIVAMIYNNGTNEAAGGHITTSGNIIIWANPKNEGNNYQVRVNAVYPVN